MNEIDIIDIDGIEDVDAELAPAGGTCASTGDAQLAPAADAVVLPGYYASVRATRTFELGQYVRVLRVEGRGPSAIVHYQHRAQSYTQDAASFLADFAPAPEGEAALNRRMLEVTEAISLMSQDVAGLQQALQHVTVHVDAEGEAAGLEAITAIVPVDDRSHGGFKVALARVRRLAQAKQAELQARQNELQAILAEKMVVAKALLAPLQEMVGRIEEAIWTVNLYLGRDEAIVRLRDGEPAPASTPISLQQLVLAMDEECAVAAEEGGIDARSIAQFDAWLLERPEHLDQVLVLATYRIQFNLGRNHVHYFTNTPEVVCRHEWMIQVATTGGGADQQRGGTGAAAGGAVAQGLLWHRQRGGEPLCGRDPDGNGDLSATGAPDPALPHGCGPRSLGWTPYAHPHAYLLILLKGDTEKDPEC